MRADPAGADREADGLLALAQRPNVTSALSARRGQILGFAPVTSWRGWERIEAYLPQSERQDLIAELRGLTQGLGAFTCAFDHMEELAGRIADQVVKSQAPAH